MDEVAPTTTPIAEAKPNGGDLLERLLAIAEKNGIQGYVVNTITKDMDRILRFYRRYGLKPW